MKTWKFTCKNFSLTCPLEIFMKLKLSYHRWFRGEALIIDYVLNVFQKWQKSNFEQNSLLHVVYTQILFFITECLIWIALLFFFLTFLDKNQILIFSKYMQTCNHCKKKKKRTMRKYVIFCIFLQRVTYRFIRTEACIVLLCNIFCNLL